MKHALKVWIFPAACCFLLFPGVVSGQQTIQPQWQQGTSVSSPPSQSTKQPNSSQKQKPHSPSQPTSEHSQPPMSKAEQPAHEAHQPTPSDTQDTPIPSAQHEIPAIWPPAQPAVSIPGYLGIRIRNFYRERFCMHALTIQGVEVAAVEPHSPAERAGLRPARGLSAREIATATVAGLLAISPASSLAPSVLRAAGGVAHGDIILAIAGKRVKTQDQFQEALARFGPRTVVHLTIRRGEATLQLPVHLDDWPAQVSSVSSHSVNALHKN